MNKLIYLFLIVSFFACNDCKTKTSIDSVKISDNKIKQPTEQNFINYKPDIRMFTVLAFANAAGYNPFYKDSISDVRKEIRQYLDSVLTSDFKEKIKGAYKQDKRHRFIMPQIYFALNLSYPPNFWLLPDSLKAKPESRPIKNTQHYLQLLNEFYIKANIPKLWNEYSEKLERNNQKYAPYADKALENITSFCRVDRSFYSDKFRKFNFYEELLANMGWGSVFNSNDTIIFLMNYNAKGTSAFYHESLHLLVNSITNDYSSLLKTKEKIANIGLQKRIEFGAYIHLNDLFSESMVTTIDYTLREKFDNYSKEEIQINLEKEYQKGLFLVPYFYKKLQEYESSDLSLKDFYPQIIDGINYDIELEKWENQHNIQSKYKSVN